MRTMLADFVPAPVRERFDAHVDVDFSASTGTGDRYRVNIYQSIGETHAALRRVQSEIPSFQSLNLPPVYEKSISKYFEGLILVSGVTGSGKSSTLAAIVEYINVHRSMHIVTIEDPVEYRFVSKKSIISQREIGIDVPDYPAALRSAVRQDPDCIFIGEMRDRDTMLAAIQSAETGHLVLGSIHCSDAPQTFARILEFFPRQEHAFIRSSLAASLKAIFCQRLLPGIAKDSCFPACEVLLNNAVVRDKILREEDEALHEVIRKSKDDGMQTLTHSLCELIESERVHFDVAMDYAPNRDALSSAVKGISSA
jgi:twitching motility protein PilT